MGEKVLDLDFAAGDRMYGFQCRTGFLDILRVDIPAEQNGFRKGSGGGDKECARATRRFNNVARLNPQAFQQSANVRSQRQRRLEISALDFCLVCYRRIQALSFVRLLYFSSIPL